MRVVVVPAPIVASGHGTPTVCARHGETATEHHDMTFRSLVPGWLILLYFFIGPALVVLIALLIQRKVRTPAWPFCPRCAQSLTIRRIVLAGVFAVAALCAAVSVFYYLGARGDRAGGMTGAILLIVLLLLAGLRAITLATRGRVANGYVAENGMTVEFRNPHPEFLRQIVAAKEEYQRYLASVQPVTPVAPPPF
ncbi:hypothetical protein [Actinoplanes sp. NPDC049265]|uniref:hypothetical protein n=1 Tax=Actinoplanes sp. NPDC049265 TaxID=3363902 RepID=UPI0037188A70